MAIELLPPPGEVPLSKVKLNTGATVFPNLMDCGRVRVWDEDDALELERRGWTRDFHSAQAKAVAAVLLQKGLSCQIRRTAPGIGWPIQKSEAPSDAELARRGLARQLERLPRSVGSAVVKRRIEIGEVETDGEAGRVRVAHDLEQHAIVVQGIAADLGEIAPDLRAGLELWSGRFDRADNLAEQTTARDEIGRVVSQILRRHEFIGAKVRLRRFNERYVDV